MPQHYSDPKRESTKILRCAKCNEPTIFDRTSSFYGFVHRWGPTSHAFVPREATEAEALADAREGIEDE